MRATINGTVLAESDDTIVIEGNHYFPAESVRTEYFSPSDRQTSCYWKGVASYYSVEVDGERHDNVAWFYPEPLEKAAQIKDHVAFYPAVTVTE